MRLMVAVLLTLASVMSPGWSTLTAQGNAADALARAIESYRDLEYDAAAAQLNALVADEASGAAARLSGGARVRALMYLGATEVFRGRNADAAAAFTRLLLLDPGFRPDELIFPPEVTTRFDEVRRGVHAVEVVAPDSIEIASASDSFPLRLRASTPHDVRVMVVDARGMPVRLLHDGPMGDTLGLRWSGRDVAGRLYAGGAYGIEITSRGGDGIASRTLFVPLRLDRLLPDSVTPPSASFVRRPESRPGDRTIRPAIVGLVGAAVVAMLPSLISDDSEGMPVRFVVATTLAVGGVSGLIASGRPQPIPANVEWNREQFEAWQREVALAKEENATRLRSGRLRIFTEAPRVVEPQ